MSETFPKQFTVRVTNSDARRAGNYRSKTACLMSQLLRARFGYLFSTMGETVARLRGAKYVISEAAARRVHQVYQDTMHGKPVNVDRFKPFSVRFVRC